MKFKHDTLWIGAFASLSLLLTACANQGSGTDTQAKKRSFSTIAASTGTPPPQTNTSSVTIDPAGTPPYEFTIDGLGNHARHVCVPATKKLIVRMKPRPNYDPLLPLDTTLVNQLDGGLLYDGSPAYYEKLRLRISIPGTSAAWDYLANVESWSVKGDYSSFIGQGSAPANIPQTSFLNVPEYENQKIIFGSNPNDSICTFWEKQLGRCSQISSQARESEKAICPSGQQKLLISNVVSDYPCLNDRTNWCKGGAIQTVPDYQHWIATIQVATEDTLGLQ